MRREFWRSYRTESWHDGQSTHCRDCPGRKRIKIRSRVGAGPRQARDDLRSPRADVEQALDFVHCLLGDQGLQLATNADKFSPERSMCHNPIDHWRSLERPDRTLNQASPVGAKMFSAFRRAKNLMSRKG